MTYFLDTNTCIYFLKGKHPEVRDRMLSIAPANIRIPSMVSAELFLGAKRSGSTDRAAALVRTFLNPFEVVAFDHEASIVYADIRHSLERKGQTIGPNDLIIAATVLTNGGTLVTHNIAEFKRVKGLLVEDWVGLG